MIGEIARLLPQLVRLVRAIRGSGRDPKKTIEELASGYEIRRELDRRVDEAIARRFD